jgi:hypothetical protein
MREVIDRVVQQRLDQGQLREAPITLRQLSIVKREFARVLGGMYHARVEYPKAPVRPSRRRYDAGHRRRHRRRAHPGRAGACRRARRGVLRRERCARRDVVDRLRDRTVGSPRSTASTSDTSARRM